MKLLQSLLGLILLVPAVQADSITTITLSNRPAEEIIPVIKPMLGANDAISGRGFRIFLRSSPETLAQVNDMIETLDISARVLQISVFQGSTRYISELGIESNVQIKSGDASVNIGTAKRDDVDGSGSITYSSNKGTGVINGHSTRKRLDNNPIHQVRVTEGSEAYIETGEQIPFFSGADWIGPGGIVGDIEYKNVITGFYVLPRLHGDNVTLQVSPFKNSLSLAGAGNIETQHAGTTLSGRIGEWLFIGGVSEQLQRTKSDTGRYVSTQSNNNQSIWIRAVVAR